MSLKISGPNELRERLERLRPQEVMAKVLAEQAQRIAARVREGLSEPPGGAGHDEPWLQSGALRDSVGAQAENLQAAVGSSDPAAVPQELGTSRMPARPFLAPVAAEMGGEVARAVGDAVAAALRGDDPSIGNMDATNADTALSENGAGSNYPGRNTTPGVGAPTSTSIANETWMGGSPPAANGASPSHLARHRFAGPGTPMASPLYNQNGSISLTQNFVPLPTVVQTLTSSVDTEEVIATAGPGTPDQLTPAGEALRKQLAQISQSAGR